MNMQVNEGDLGHYHSLRLPPAPGKHTGDEAVKLTSFVSDDEQAPKSQKRIHPIDHLFTPAGACKTGDQIGIPTGGNDMGSFSIKGLPRDPGHHLADDPDSAKEQAYPDTLLRAFSNRRVNPLHSGQG